MPNHFSRECFRETDGQCEEAASGTGQLGDPLLQRAAEFTGSVAPRLVISSEVDVGTANAQKDTEIRSATSCCIRFGFRMP